MELTESQEERMDANADRELAEKVEAKKTLTTWVEMEIDRKEFSRDHELAEAMRMVLALRLELSNNLEYLNKWEREWGLRLNVADSTKDGIAKINDDLRAELVRERENRSNLWGKFCKMSSETTILETKLLRAESRVRELEGKLRGRRR